VIARKFRPQIFQDLVGQNHVTQTLQNSLKNNRLPHALLFTGPRGTGKTSSARILAKALRCPDAKDFTPCGVCSSCEEIAGSRSLDVIEIDGASNNGVDSIRELRDTVAYQPNTGRYKVYIIDEVHMLSSSAFNALLKTLEEPPSHVVFIMATTEVHKIPQTILSRCQRFDFRRISTRSIVEQLKNICSQEKVEFEEESLWILGRQGDGSMRDSLTLLDQVISFSNGPLKAAQVSEILGLTDRSLLLGALKTLIDSNTQETIEILKKLNFSGVYPELFARELLESLRTLMIVKVAGSELEMIDRPESEITVLAELATSVTEESLHFLFDMAMKVAQDVSKTADPQIVLEMGLLRMAQASKLLDLTQIAQTPSAGVAVTPTVGTSAPSTTKPASIGNSPAAQKPAMTQAPAPAAPVAAAKTFLKAANPSDKWLALVNHVRSKDPLFTAKIENLLFIREQDKVLQFSVAAKHMFLSDTMKEPETRAKLQSFIDSLWGENYTFQIVSAQKVEKAGESANKMAEKKVEAQDKEIEEQIRKHPAVQAAQKVFQGEVKPIPTDRNRR
jgi:DNA polymerase-3 subunit gamma/tau